MKIIIKLYQQEG